MEERTATYLQIAAASVPELESKTGGKGARESYNAACAELTVLLRNGDGGRLWNRPITVTRGGISYQLRFQPGTANGVWAPDYFTKFELARRIDERLVKTPNRRAGLGGELVGVRKIEPREEFMPRVGLAGAVTATLDFRGRTATLTLQDPMKKETIRVDGRVRPLAADFSAPLCYYPPIDQFWTGLIEGLHPGAHGDTESIFLLQPYDPARIPVFYIHGLISTPYIWRDPINQIDQDPELRARFQPIVFDYPTGDPVAYSALRFRERMAEFERRYPMPNGYVIVSHSMGGLVAQMLTQTVTRENWHRVVGAKADELFASVPPESEISRALIFDADPAARRVVFIATPHKGANMATGSLANFAQTLIRLPFSVVKMLGQMPAATLSFATGSSKRMPTSLTSLEPQNPTLHVLAAGKVAPPCHSIIGNRGLPGPLADSSDGIVPYWSSHLDYAKSEVIVPGPHSCYDYPQSIAEIKRILHLQLKSIK
ncbi:MAG: alpha/beta hydrolase [Chthoniobacteraceae bacterium]